MNDNKLNAHLIITRIVTRTIMNQMNISLTINEEERLKEMEKHYQEELDWLNNTFEIMRKNK